MSFDTFDPEEVLREFGDEATAAELATIVRTDVTQYAAVLQQAAAAGDLARVREVAHALKGAAGTVAAGPVCELASRIDTGLRGGDSAAAQVRPRARRGLRAPCRGSRDVARGVAGAGPGAALTESRCECAGV